jgi:hypothetical protein
VVAEDTRGIQYVYISNKLPTPRNIYCLMKKKLIKIILIYFRSYNSLFDALNKSFPGERQKSLILM